jgi:hypothetical protein
VTVRDWVVERTAHAPASLVDSMVRVLGDDADAPVAAAGDVCVRAASRSLEQLVAEQRFARASALDLLTIDALTALAFERAAEDASDMDALSASAARGLQALATASLARV